MTAPRDRIIPDNVFNGVICSPLKIRFPTLHRVDGYYWDLIDDQLVETDRIAKPYYTLDPDAKKRFCKPAVTPLLALDPKIDQGWFFIVHHPSESHRDGYLDAAYNLATDEGYDHGDVLKTKFGLFTLRWRPNPKDGREGNLIIYEATVPATGEVKRISETENWRYPIGAHGSWVDPDDLVPPEYAEAIDDLKSKDIDE